MAASPNPEAFVRWLRQVAPYVHAFRGRTFVVAFGGELFTERARFLSFVHDLNLLAALGIRLVLVHGAGRQIETGLKAKVVRSRYAQGHDALTGSTADGRAFTGAEDRTCKNYTSNAQGAVMLGHIDRQGLRDDAESKSWNSSHPSRGPGGGCSQDDLKSTGGAGLFYCFATN